MTDTAHENVISIGMFGELRHTIDSNGPAGQVLKECKKLAKSRLEDSIARMMEKADDTLFARAEKAENNQVQTLYFDAMRELRIIRNDIETAFIAEFEKRFDVGMPRVATTDNGLKLDWDSDQDGGVGLIDKDALEEDLAVTNMINKVRGTCTQSLYTLDKRIGLLIQDPDLERWFNPLGPEAICNAFKVAAQKIQTGIEIRLVIFKLFDTRMISQIETFYKELNQHLVNRGILPEVKATYRKTPSGLVVQQIDTQATTEAGNTTTQTHGQFPGGSSINQAHGYVTQSIVNPPVHALTYLQQGSLPAIGQTAGFNPGAIDMENLGAGNVNVLHNIKQSGLIDSLGKSGDMTIDIVAMLFDYILDDTNIPATIEH